MSEQDFISGTYSVGSSGTPSLHTDPGKGVTEDIIEPPKTTRLQMEFEGAKKAGQEGGYTVELINNDYELWSVKFYNFKDLPIEKDMIEYEKLYHRNYIELLFTFPANYPNIAPFIRVYRPRFVLYTGHVTEGGSICSASLTFNGWTPVRTISSLIAEIFALMMSGDAGDAPPRLNLSNDTPYDLPGAVTAFRRAAKKHIWEIPDWEPTK